MFAKVPRAMTRSLPLRAPYELKSTGSMWLLIKKRPAGEFLDILPAGEMWSVVMESPKNKRQYALVILGIGLGLISMEEKKGGLWMYVDFSFQLYCDPLGAHSWLHCLVPVSTLA